jgi:DNA-binding NtrC family response regulator
MEHLTSKLERFDLIITDLRMPILGGQTILGAAAVALPDVPVITITAFGTPELKAQCLGQGAAAFLEKPLNTPQLLAAIEQVFAPAKPHLTRRARRRAAKAIALTTDKQTDFLGCTGGLAGGIGF